MKIRNFLLMLIFFMLAITLMPNTISAAVEDTFINDGVKYKVLTETSNNGTIQIVDYDNNKAKLTIPQIITYNDKQYTVTDIGYGAFYGCDVLTNIELPDSVTGIGDNAFGGCTSLTSIIIPSLVKAIPYNCFGGCNSLVNVALPDSLECIVQSSFSGCSSIKSLFVPKLVTSIEYNAFGGCSSLETILIPDSVTWIGYEAFGGCRSLTTIYGYENSLAEEYANNNRKNFVKLDSTVYKVINSLTNLTSSGMAFVDPSMQNYTATLTAGFGATLPSSIIITMGENTLTASTDYTYNNGEIIITKAITGDIEIIADGVMIKKSVNTVLTNIVSDGEDYVYPALGNYIANLTASLGYKLPDSITVKVGNLALDNTQYKYDSKAGELVVLAKNITDDITIEATALEEIYKVTFYANGGKFGEDDTYIIDDWDYTLYDTLIKPTREGYTFKGYYTESIGGTKLEMILNESGIDSDMEFYAQWEKIVTQKDETPETGSKDNLVIVYIVAITSFIGCVILRNKKIKEN